MDMCPGHVGGRYPTPGLLERALQPSPVQPFTHTSWRSPAELARRFERRSRTYEARALPTELHQRKTLEVAGRIALPMICFAGRCLAVLATPPHNIGAEGGTRTRALVLSLP